MKKLLGILGATGLVATSGASVIACSSTIKNDDNSIKIGFNVEKFNEKINNYSTKIGNLSEVLDINSDFQMIYLESSEFLWSKIESYFLDLKKELSVAEWSVFHSLFKKNFFIGLVDCHEVENLKKTDSIKEAMSKIQPEPGAKEWGIFLSFGTDDVFKFNEIEFWVYKLS
ncbi:hypothetical protein LD119_00328 [Mesoplasma sp. JKS002660]|uniref:lipoprotein n=1 Tax=Mesoplasma whartonense TaxID=2878854 RepID=UPI002022A8ED|nr:lipoprotein [Mesoplasma sp. JKS002660]MCL8213400.1 hypothetical protein [Mesoplasma sp. JKS002660]